MEQINDFYYLWDGTENWVLLKSESHQTKLTVHFSTLQPSVSEIVALRKMLKEYQDIPLADLKKLLGNSGKLEIPPMPYEEALNFIQCGHSLGISLEAADEFVTAYFPFRKADNRVEIIEHDDLAKRVYQRVNYRSLKEAACPSLIRLRQ